MTATQPQPQPQPPLFGQAVGEAQTALKAAIDDVLAEAGTNFESWLALNLLATRGPAIPSNAYQQELVEGLRAEPRMVSELVARLQSTGLIVATRGTGVDGGGQVELTGDGKASHARLREAVARTSARLLSGFDPDDVQTTIKVLREVTSRAQASPVR